MNQQKEAARQILGHVSDIQAEVSLCGMDGVSLKLASIREKAASLLEEEKGAEVIIESYEKEARESILMLAGVIDERGGGLSRLDDAEMRQILRVAEVCISRLRVCLDRRERYVNNLRALNPIRQNKRRYCNAN